MCNYFCSLNGYRVETDMRAPCSSGNFSGIVVRQIAETSVYRLTSRIYVGMQWCVCVCVCVFAPATEDLEIYTSNP